ncbi:P-selectin-like isoform X2 [Branchiostoma floridae]|uniref:P-selectin-like isoform X2 n=1 Tax=Branchiostoma floridae TaxID=7739 RepID=A0A9J7LDA0_BRAFL|nr:P-selectin-like isoform X2 [Branchiostoma floridae]
MMRVGVLLTLVLIAALVWQSEAKPTSPSSCSRPPYGMGVKTTNCENRIPYREGETCRFKCQNGYRRTSGDTSRTCTDKSWSGNMLICEQYGCERPGNLGGFYSRVGRTGCEPLKPLYDNGETCTFACKDGYVAEAGDPSITCKNGGWSGTPLTCTPELRCKDPPSSSTAYIRGCQSPYEEGETCTFECRPGFERYYGNVNANITCTRGYWIGESLICL